MRTELDPLQHLDAVAGALRGRRFLFGSEVALHAALGTLLAEQGIEFTHEEQRGRDRFDFFVGNSVVLEVKIKGSLQSAISQVARYCSRADVNGVALLACTPWINTAPRELVLSGKPVRFYKIGRVYF